MVLFDSVGLTLFVPLLQVADESNVTGENDKLIQVVQSFFDFIHLPVTIITMLVFIVLVFVLKAFFVYFVSNYSVVAIQNMSREMRIHLSLSLRDLSFREFVMMDIGRLQNSLTGEVNRVMQACQQYIETIKNGMIVFVYMLFAFLLDWRFSLLITIGGFLTNFIYKIFYKRTKQISQEITDNNHYFSGIIIEEVNHFKYLKASGRNQSFTNRMLKILDEVILNYIKIGKLNAIVQAMREPMMISIICAVIALQVLVFQSSLTSVLIILVLFYRALTYMMNLQTSWNSYLANYGALENIQQLQSYLSGNAEHKGGKFTVERIQQIVLKDVSLRYDDITIINRISMEIQRNQSIAFVGESGAGKTTLANIICALLSYDDGEMLINNIPVEQLNRNEYRNKIGYITQEPTIFNADIFDNVTFWAERDQKNIVKFWRVVEMCSLTVFLKSLPHQEKELLGNNGINISGGQKQRISIARELFRDVEILIMDEATSALDSETEREIKESMETLHGKVTIISIAHRLSTIKKADCIYLLAKGELIANGNFEELKQKSTYFSKLANLQGL